MLFLVIVGKLLSLFPVHHAERMGSQHVEMEQRIWLEAELRCGSSLWVSPPSYVLWAWFAVWRARGVMYDAYKIEHRETKWRTPLACKQNIRVYSKPLISCQSRFGFVCWCRRTLAVVLFLNHASKFTVEWKRELVRLKERECCYWITGDGC